MAQFVKLQMTGFNELDEALRQLPKTMSRSVLLKALKKAAKPSLRKGRAEAPKGQGDLADSVDVRPMRRRRYGVEVALGPNAPHAHLVELGTRPRVTIIAKKRALSDGTEIFGVRVENGAMKPNRFWTRSWEMTKMEDLQILGDSIWEELFKAAERLGKKASVGRLSGAEKEALGG